MKKKFVLNLILLLLLNLLIKPFYIFFVDRNVQNVVGTEEYGLYFAIYNLTFVINIFLDMGIVNFNNRHIAQNPQLLRKHFAPIVTLRLLLGLLYFVIAFAVAAVLGYSARQFALLGILAFNQFLLSFILYLRSNISGQLKFVTDSFLSVLDRFLLIVFCLILLYAKCFAGKFRIEWFIFAQTAAYMLTAITAFCVVLKNASFQRLKFDKKFFFLILKKSFPFAVLTLLMAFYNRVDSVMLSELLPGNEGDIQAGIYAHAFRLLEALNNFAYLFAVLLLPIFSRMLKQKEDVRSIVKVAFNLLAVFSFSFASVGLFFGYDIMNVMYTEHVDISAKACNTLMFCLPGMSFGYLFGTLLTANGSLKYLNIIAAAGMTLNLILNFILIPKYGVIGAAITGVITQSTVSIAQVFVTKKVFHFNADNKTILTFLLFIVLLFVSGALIVRLNIWTWYWKMLLQLCVAVLLAIILNMFNIREMLVLLRPKKVE
ncbi:MAG: oligosaccharide flippase family protein [Bacteroidales bacterium]|nr:oligosaccharide flippase family protein [Bacteroidales bacterium]